MKLNKVAFAVASVLAIASGAAQAGQIDSSSATLAREVIWNDAQVVRAPSKAYSFSGDVDATKNEQRFQLQYTLSKGEWAVGTGNVIGAAAADGAGLFDISASGLLMVNGQALNTAIQNVIAKAFVPANEKNKLVINVTVPKGTPLLRAPSWLLNAGSNTAQDNVGITKLFTVAGAVSCSPTDSALDIDFKQATTHSDSANVGDATAPGAEHTRTGSTNTARLLNFVQNLNFAFTPSGTASQIDSAKLRTQFVLSSNNTVKEHTLGTVKLARLANGLDLDYTKKYANTGAPVSPATFVAGDFNNAVGAVNVGEVDLAATNGLTIKVDGAMAKGSWLELRDATGTLISTLKTTPLAAAASTATLNVTTKEDVAAVANGAKVVYVVDGFNEIPDQGDFSVTASLNKEAAGSGVTTGDFDQNLSCNKPLTGLGNSGIKIDVRNYASYATFGDKGPATTLRIINNSESRTADLYAQMIYADGRYGPWGMVGTLAPRAAMNISNKDLEAKMENAPKSDNPFGTGTVYTSASGSAVLKNSTGGGDRVRIMSNSGSTLRVQSYMVVGNTVLDTSNAQGVDFENGGSRVPSNAVDAQPVSQDAVNGISK
jgi:hypothetical protein